MSETNRLAKMSAARQKYELVLERHPSLREIEDKLINLHTDRVLKRSSTERQGWQGELQHWQDLRADYLLQHGIPEDFAEPEWDCPLCQDTGVLAGRACRCEQQRWLEHRFQGARLPERLREQTFDQFSLEWYATEKQTPFGISEQQNAREVLDACRTFVARAMESLPSAPSLFINGNTGLGKTFLSSAICHALAENGILSLYITYSDLISNIKAGFDATSSGVEDLLAIARRVPVLILDDLGAEYITDFSIRCLFDIVNHRRNERLPMVISSNLTLSEVSSRYDERIASRLLEVCLPVRLFGTDIRTRMLQRKRGLI